jgi:hypothetical protein
MLHERAKGLLALQGSIEAMGVLSSPGRESGPFGSIHPVRRGAGDRQRHEGRDDPLEPPDRLCGRELLAETGGLYPGRAGRAG